MAEDQGKNNVNSVKQSRAMGRLKQQVAGWTRKKKYEKRIK